MTKPTDADLVAANEAVREQWAKFDAAVEAGLTGAPLARIDQKLRRLQDKADALYDAITYPA